MLKRKSDGVRAFNMVDTRDRGYGGGKIEFGALEESEYQMEFSVFGDCVFLYVFHIFTLFISLMIKCLMLSS